MFVSNDCAKVRVFHIENRLHLLTRAASARSYVVGLPPTSQKKIEPIFALYTVDQSRWSTGGYKGYKKRKKERKKSIDRSVIRTQELDGADRNSCIKARGYYHYFPRDSLQSLYLPT